MSKKPNENAQNDGSLLVSDSSATTIVDDIDERLEAEIYATLNGTSIKGFHGNKQLKGAGEVIEYTPEQIKIYKRCAKDPLYFINHFVKVVTLDHGLQQIKLRDYQRDLVKAFIKNRMNIVLAARLETGAR